MIADKYYQLLQNAGRIRSRIDQKSYMTTVNRLFHESQNMDKDFDIQESEKKIEFLIKEISCRALVKVLMAASEAFNFKNYLTRDVQRNKDLLLLALTIHYNEYAEILNNIEPTKKKIAKNFEVPVQDMINECKHYFESYDDNIRNGTFNPYVMISKLEGCESRIITTRRDNDFLSMVLYQKGPDLIPLCYYKIVDGVSSFVPCDKSFSSITQVKHVPAIEFKNLLNEERTNTAPGLNIFEVDNLINRRSTHFPSIPDVKKYPILVY